MAVALVLCLFAFVLLAAGEAWAAEQPLKTTQPGTVESTTTINGKVAEPVPGTTKPPVVTPPVEKPPAEAPAPPPPTNETPPAEDPAPPPPASETPPTKEPSPPPIEQAPSAPEPEVAAPQPAPRPALREWFTATTDGEEDVDSAPVLDTSQSVIDFGRVLEPEPMKTAPAPAPVAPAAPGDGHAPDTILTITDPAAASEQVLPAASGLGGLVQGLLGQGLVAEPADPPATSRGDGGPLALPANSTPPAGLTSPAPTVVPASVGGALRLPSSLGNTTATTASAVGTAVGTIRSTAASVATEVLGALSGDAPGASYTDATNVTQEEESSEGTPQQPPAPPLAPPAGGGSFSPSMGGGQLGTGSGFAPLLVGILALLATSLLRRDFRTYLVSCDMLKPSSALLLPLERPG